MVRHLSAVVPGPGRDDGRARHRGGSRYDPQYLYRAVDKHGKTVDFLLRRDRGIAAAQASLRKALASTLPRLPRKVTLDGQVPSHRALWLLRREHPCWRNVKVRTNKYLNNIVEQDHRAIKRRCASMAGFKSFANAALTVAGIELARFVLLDE
jgi:transposase-like protein